MRFIISVAVMIAAQALAGCGMPAQGGVARDDRPAWRNVEFEVRDARLRRQVEAGTFGLAQLYPAGAPVDARHLRPLPPPSAVPIPVVNAGTARTSPSEASVRVTLAVAQGGRHNACVYKPIMSDADIAACS